MPLIEYKWTIQSTTSGTPLNKIDPFIHHWKSWVLVFFLIADSGIKVSTRSIQIQKIGVDIQRWLCLQHLYKLHQFFNEVTMVNCFLPIHAHITLVISVKYFRFLKFIALFLDNYTLNADGDVKGMFETAYRSLLKAHPDLKSLKKHSVCYHRNSIPNCPLS